LDTVLRSTKSL